MVDGRGRAQRGGRDLRRPSLFQRVAGAIIGTIIHRFGRLEVTGREHVPAKGAVVVSNHVGWLDPVWIAAALWPRPAFYMAKKELFVPLFGHLISALGAFPINRRAPGPSSLKLPLEMLANNALVVVFPGGTRSANVGEIKRGAATIAVLAACPVLPVRYHGPARPRLRDLLRRPPVLVEFLPAINPHHDGTRAGSRGEPQRLSLLIKNQLEGVGPRA